MATTTVATILGTTLTNASEILTANLPTVFTFLIIVAAIWYFFRKIKGGMKSH